jgi:hypothetical protein
MCLGCGRVVPPRRVVKKPYFFAVQKLLERCRNLDSELPAGQKRE